MSVPFEFRGVVRLTKVGTTYILATIILAIAAVNTGNNALYIGVAFMLGSLLLSGIASKSGLKHLEVEIFGLDEAWVDRAAAGMVRVRNRSRVWNVRDVVLASASLEAPLLVTLAPRNGEVVLPARFVFRRRGLAHVEGVDSYTRYPFGFFLKKRRLRVASEVVVFPRILPESLVGERFRMSAGEQSSGNRPGPGSEIHSFREFVRGDSLRHVAWKKSASLGRWIMKQTEVEAARAVHVVVDPFKPRAATDEEFEEMITAAATFVFDAARRGLDIVLSLPRVTVRAREHQSAAALFRALALVEPAYEPVAQILDRDSVVFRVSGGQHDAKSA